MHSATINLKETLGVGVGAFGVGAGVGVGAFGAVLLSRPRAFLPQRLVLSCPRAWATGLSFPQHSSHRRIIPRSSRVPVAGSEHIDLAASQRSLYAVQTSSQTSPYAVHLNGYVVYGSDSRITADYYGAILTNSYPKRFRIFGDIAVGFAGCAALFEDLKVAVDENRGSLGNPKKMAEIADFVCCLLNKILLNKYDKDLRDLVDATFIVAGRCEDDTDIFVVERHGNGLPFSARSSGHEAMVGSGTRAMREYVRKNPLPIDADEMSCVRHVFEAIQADPATGGTIRVSVAGQHGWEEYVWLKEEEEDGVYTGPFPDDYDDEGFNIC